MIETQRRNLWTFELGNGRRLPGVARLRDEWIELVLPLPDLVDAELPWRLLADNGRLRGPARFVRHDETRMGITADLPAAREDREPMITAALDSIQEAILVHHGDPVPEPAAGHGIDPDWTALAAEHGWKVAPREDGRVGVELDAPGVMSQGFIEPAPAGPLVCLTLLRTATLEPVCRRAIAWFLLSLTSRLHLVRASIRPGESESLSLEVPLPAAAVSARWLDLALEALSLAARSASREVRALSREPLARTYLAHTLKE